MSDKIIIKGARQHNLKNINLEIPKNKLVVITGISGSGKSSLAFDTLYAEGQRRYVESLSAYARQFLGLMEKPDVDLIEGLSPAIAIEQRKIARNPRSTVATVTEIYDYLRLLFARIGKPYCPDCKIPLEKSTLDEIIKYLIEKEKGNEIMILAPKIKGRKGEYRELFEKIKRDGWVRIRVDGKIYDIDEVPKLERYKIHSIEIVIDRISIKEGAKTRLADSIEQGLREGEGIIKIISNEKEERIFSEKLMCPKCSFSIPELEPRMFSFNSPYGACEKCSGLGFKYEIDPNLLINPRLSIMEGSIRPIGEPRGWLLYKLERLARIYNTSLEEEWRNLPEKFKNVVLFGKENIEDFDPENPEGDYEFYEGIIPFLLRKYSETDSEWVIEEIERYLVKKPCPVCKGARLKRESLWVLIENKNIYEITKMDVISALNFFENLKLNERQKLIAKQILKEIKSRLSFLKDVGLTYLTLDRTIETLSGGEDQRVRLATQIGSGLTGVMYVLDEPTVGLHPRDNEKLLNTLKKLRDLGNTVIVVEHDRQTIESADFVIDLGPGAGEAGGYVVFTGTPSELKKFKKSLTGKYLSYQKDVPVPKKRRKPCGKYLTIYGATGFNLKNIDVKFPIGLFICVTGVSGSGKSTLVIETLYKALRRMLYNSPEIPLPYERIEGIEYINKVINIDQSPIGRTPRSNPATYTGVFTPIRELFASLPESRKRGYTPGRFSFNVKGGRCENCWGEGFIKLSMQFLPDVYIPCDVCKGKRYNEETLEVKFKGYSIADILDKTVDEAYKIFENIPAIERKLSLLKDVGLGYIKLGQPATTLSGGEAQRIKLSKELSKIATGKTLYILDEPTTGLHFEDVKNLLNILQRLVNMGNTVIVIEHNLDVIKCADYIIDLGPEGGEEGGYLVAEGPPEEIIKNEKSYTGKFLKKILEREKIEIII
ncbi:MAG: excinuclease ABC subunit UvrA [candidate division WOR-3 bacterium]